MRKEQLQIGGGRFVVATSGSADGPSQALSRFLVERDAAEVWVVSHPLVAEGEPVHRVDELVGGAQRSYRRPNRPPLTYLFDPITPLRLPRADAWFGFNCLVTAQGLTRRRFGRVDRVIHWSVDFVPRRFGDSPLTGVYDRLDRRCIVSADARVELSDAAYRGRLESYGLTPSQSPASIVPMGSWLAEAPVTSSASLHAPRIVFLGHLVERMGVPLVLEAVRVLRDDGVQIHADVIGGGPLLDSLRSKAVELGVADRVTFHGFVDDFADVRRLLAGAAIAVAPYEVDDDSFSRFADPGKLKAYLAAGLPVVLTPVPPNAAELAAQAGAEIVGPDAVSIAGAIRSITSDRSDWERRHLAARAHIRRFDWNVLLTDALPELGVEVEQRSAP